MVEKAERGYISGIDRRDNIMKYRIGDTLYYIKYSNEGVPTVQSFVVDHIYAYILFASTTNGLGSLEKRLFLSVREAVEDGIQNLRRLS